MDGLGRGPKTGAGEGETGAPLAVGVADGITVGVDATLSTVELELGVATGPVLTGLSVTDGLLLGPPPSTVTSFGAASGGVTAGSGAGKFILGVQPKTTKAKTSGPKKTFMTTPNPKKASKPFTLLYMTILINYMKFILYNQLIYQDLLKSDANCALRTGAAISLANGDPRC